MRTSPYRRDKMYFSLPMIFIGNDVIVGRQIDPKDDLLYNGYFGRVVDIKDEYALVDSDATGLFQSVSFKAWLPMRTLTRTA